MNYGDVLTVTLTLFAVIDILGSIPIIIGLRSKMGHIQSEKATLVSGLIMILFLFIEIEPIFFKYHPKIGIKSNSFLRIKTGELKTVCR